MVDKHEREHGFGDGGGAQADAGVVSAVGGELDGVAVDVDAAARGGDGTGGFDGNYRRCSSGYSKYYTQS